MTNIHAIMQYSRNYIMGFVASVAVTALSFGSVMVGAANLPNGTANNPVPAGREVCDLNIGFVIDRSNSIRNDSEANPAIITNAVNNIVTDLKGTDSKVAVWSFGTKATGYTGANPLPDSPAIAAADFPGIGFTAIKQDSGVNAVKNVVASIPYESENSDRDLRRAGWTNWQAALAEANANGSRPADADIVFMITDGDPTLPQANPGASTADKVTPVVAGVEAANSVKANGSTRIVAFAVGQATSETDYIDNIKRITGGLESSVRGQDYFIGGFSELGSMLKSAIDQACVEPTPAPSPTTPTPPAKPAALPVTGINGMAIATSLIAGIAAGSYVHIRGQRKLQ